MGTGRYIVGGCFVLGVLLATISMIALSACTPPSIAPTPSQGKPEATPLVVAPTATAVVKRDLTEDMLKNSKYELPDLGAFQLKDGSYEQKYGEGANQVNKVGFERATLGDLNSDGARDAAVVLWWHGGGSGTFVNLVAVVNDNGTPRQVATRSLGDRVQIKSLSIQDGKIRVDMVAHGPNDPLCCPSQEVTRTYLLQDTALTQAS